MISTPPFFRVTPKPLFLAHSWYAFCCFPGIGAVCEHSVLRRDADNGATSGQLLFTIFPNFSLAVGIMKTISGVVVLAVGLLCGVCNSGIRQAAAEDVYDVQADWSDLNNPNGSWGYREADNFLPAVASWQQTLGGWTIAQPGWARSEDGNDRLPFWFRSNGSETLRTDWFAGDIVVHSWDALNGAGNGDANLTWTSPINAPVDISGSVWIGRDIGRAVDWKLWVNGIQLTGGSLFSGDAFDRANPFDLASGSGGARSWNMSISSRATWCDSSL